MSATIDASTLLSNPAFSGDAITPSHPDYSQAIARWSLTGVRQAAVVIYPKDSQSTSAAVLWATSQGTPLAVKCGGNSVSGASSIDGGVVIDLEKYINSVVVNTDTKTVALGGGARWAKVDEETMKYGLATVAPPNGIVGAGGFILGGGCGILSGQVGLASDNLLEATLVTADGKILKASNSENSDLFWGLRGGGGNFGIVTEFVMRLYPQQENVYGGILAFPGDPETVRKVFDATAEWHTSVSPNRSVSLYLCEPPHIGKPTLVAQIFYNGSESEGKVHFEYLFDLGPLNPGDVKEIPYTVFNNIQAQFAPPGLCYYVHASSHDPDTNATSAAINLKLIELNSREGNVISHSVLFDFDSRQKFQSIPTEATAFPRRDVKGNSLILLSWEKNDPATGEQARKNAWELATLAGNPEDVPFPNNHANDQVPPEEVAKVFKGNYRRLQQVKAKYDPTGVFSKWFGVEPLP